MASSRNRSPADLDSVAARAIEPHARHGARFAVGLSGGVDSVALLHALCHVRDGAELALSAIHVDHGLSGQSGQWARFCAALCAEWNVPLTVLRVDVERHSTDGLEGAARRARYDAFAGQPFDFLLLAHHRNDQAETLLLNLLRGAGVGGAAAMSPHAEMRLGNRRLRILRPWLDQPRAAIEDYAARHGLHWVTDESNATDQFSRNFLRTRVLPLLAERFPGGDAALARAAVRFAEAEALLDQLAQTDAMAADRDLAAAALRQLSEERACNVLRWFLKEHGVAAPSAARLAEYARQLRQAPDARSLSLPLGARRLVRYRGRVWVEHTQPSQPAALAWRGEDELPWGGARVRFTRVVGQGIAVERLAEGDVVLRRRGGHERMQPDCRRPRRTLKNLFQEAGVPPSSRTDMPLLFCGDELVWVPGIGVDCRYQARLREPGWLPEWVTSA